MVVHRQTFSLPPLLVILGPTGSGKSDLAVRLAHRFNGELVSADSRQIYIGMDIATNKLKQPHGIRQRMVNVVKPDYPYTVRHYQRAAMAVIKNIHRQSKLPILVGGTMQYIDAVIENWRIPSVRPGQRFRKILEHDLQHDGLIALVRRLKRIDPESVGRIDTKNPRRVIRAFEVALATGGSFVGQRRMGKPRYNVFKIGLTVDRQDLRERLQKRTFSMVRRGLVAETRGLLKKYNSSLPSMSGIGYAEAIAFINGDISKEEMINRIVNRSMQYARRQMTWWKRDNEIVWVVGFRKAVNIVKEWSSNYNNKQ